MAADTWQVEQVRWERLWNRADRAIDTFYTYRRDVDKYQKWCAEQGLQSNALDSADLYIDHVERSASRHAARHAARGIKAYGKYLVADELWPPTPGARPGKDSGPFQRLMLPVEPVPTNAPTATDDDLDKLLDACVPSKGVVARPWEALRDKAIIHTIASTGMRRSEVARMTLDDLDLVDGTVKIPKTKSKTPRRVALGTEAVGAILRYMKASEDDRPEGMRALWMSAHDMKQLEAGGISQMLARRANAAGVAVAAHAFRRRHAGEWMKKGGSESGLMTNSGWKTPSMILRYSRSTAEDNAIAEAKRLFEG